MTRRTLSVEYAPGIPHKVAIEEVEPLLSTLWEEAEQGPEQEPAPLLKVRTLNLVVHVSGMSELERLRSALAEISAAHPGRVMILCPDPQAPHGQISAQATIYCSLARHGKQHTCGEEITLTAWGEALEQIHTAVLSLRLSDLPSFLWWASEPPLEEERFSALVATADRLILDSASYSQPLSQLQRSIALLKARRGVMALSDLNWTRITHWREFIAQFYDDREALATLDQLSEVLVEYGEGSGGLIQGLLLIGWISSRLGWQPSSGRRLDQGTALLLSAPNRQVTATLRPARDIPAAQGLCRVQFGGDDSSFSISCDHQAGMAQVEVRLPARDPVLSKRRMQHESIAGLMRQELIIAGHDPVFEAALLQAARMATLIG